MKFAESSDLEWTENDPGSGVLTTRTFNRYARVNVHTGEYSVCKNEDVQFEGVVDPQQVIGMAYAALKDSVARGLAQCFSVPEEKIKFK